MPRSWTKVRAGKLMSVLYWLAEQPVELTFEMRWSFKGLNKATFAALLIAGLLLAFVASHGCDAKGTSPVGDTTAATQTAD